MHDVRRSLNASAALVDRTFGLLHSSVRKAILPEYDFEQGDGLGKHKSHSLMRLELVEGNSIRVLRVSHVAALSQPEATRNAVGAMDDDVSMPLLSPLPTVDARMQIPVQPRTTRSRKQRNEPCQTRISTSWWIIQTWNFCDSRGVPKPHLESLD